MSNKQIEPASNFDTQIKVYIDNACNHCNITWKNGGNDKMASQNSEALERANTKSVGQ
ncbi:6565_t:CDS:1, partial [Gigaspora rosea]